MTLDQAATFLRISREKLNQLRRERGFPRAVRSGRRLYFNASELRLWKRRHP